MSDRAENTMRRAVIVDIDGHGGASKVVVQRHPIPFPDAGEVRVRVAYAPINPADLLLVDGRHMFRPTRPAPIGIEGAGWIDAVGDGVTDLDVGQKVVVLYGGTWSEQMSDDRVILPARDVVFRDVHVRGFSRLAWLRALAPERVSTLASRRAV